MVMLANLLVTRPVWEGQTDAWTQSLANAAKGYWVNVISSPLQVMRLASDVTERALVRDLNDMDPPGETRPIWLVSTSPSANYALDQLHDLGAALASRRRRFKFAAIGDATAEGFSRVLVHAGIAPADLKDVLTAGPSGDVDKLAPLINQKARMGELVVLLEGADNRPELAQKLMSGGLRALRMPVYTRAAERMPALPKSELPWWVLITTSTMAKPAATGLALQNIDMDAVNWIGHHPAIGQAVRAAVPNARWVMVDRLTPSTILDRISKSE
jgi:uroporphyrinogen-III synthase